MQGKQNTSNIPICITNRENNSNIIHINVESLFSMSYYTPLLEKLQIEIEFKVKVVNLSIWDSPSFRMIMVVGIYLQQFKSFNSVSAPCSRLARWTGHSTRGVDPWLVQHATEPCGFIGSFQFGPTCFVGGGEFPRSCVYDPSLPGRSRAPECNPGGRRGRGYV